MHPWNALSKAEFINLASKKKRKMLELVEKEDVAIPEAPLPRSSLRVGFY